MTNPARTAIEYGLIAAGISLAIIAAVNGNRWQPEHQVRRYQHLSEVNTATDQGAADLSGRPRTAEEPPLISTQRRFFLLRVHAGGFFFDRDGQYCLASRICRW